MMEELSKWCLKWQMNINPDKTQIVHFRVKRTAKTKIEFHLGEHLISVVDQYRYLGCTLSQHLSHKATGDSLVGGSGRALGKIIAKHYQNKGFGYKTFTKLYQACVVPVMDYCSGIWGYGDNENLDRVHHRAIRAFLGLNRFAPITGMEGDMGWLPPIIRRKVCMLRQWNRIVKMDSNRLPKILYSQMEPRKDPWLDDIQSIFTSIKAVDVLERNVPIVNSKQFYKYAEQQLLSHYNSTWSLTVESKSKLRFHKMCKNEISVANYCSVNLKRSQRGLIAKLRLGIFRINIELGRYHGISRDERLCPICLSGEIEDEIHILLHCDAYQAARDLLFLHATELENFNETSDLEKFRILTEHERMVRNTSKYLQHVLSTRQNLLTD